MIEDVLVFTPVYRLEPETVESLFALEWDGPLSYLLQRDNPFTKGQARPDGVANHLHQYQRGREMFLKGQYQAMLVIESDIIAPPDTLRRLAALDVDLAYGCYVFRSNRQPVVNVFERYPDKDGVRARNVGEPLTSRGLWKWALKQGVVPCSGAGLGCVLIQRHVLQALEFRLGPEVRRGAHCDTFFTMDAWAAGFEMKADTAVICGHKDEDGRILWPPETDGIRHQV